MKKKLISLLLCVVMLMGIMLTGCQSGKTDEENENKIRDVQSKSTFTLSMYVVTENEVPEEDQKLVSDAFNKITKSKFKTQVVLKFVDKEHYRAAVEEVIDANYRKQVLGKEAEKAFKAAKRAAKADNIATDEAWIDNWYAEHPEYAEFRETEALTGEDTTEEETVMVTVEGVEDSFISEVKYPDLAANQIDIVWIDSYDTYMKYVENEWLVRLDDELGAASKKLKEYINPNLLAWAKWTSDGTFAIPNNHTIGEYTYLLLDKKLVEKYNYDYTKLTSLATCSDFLGDIAKYEAGVKPIAAKAGDLDVNKLPQMMYWTYDAASRSINTSKFSLIGNNYSVARTVDPSVKTNSPFMPRNIFASNEFKSQLLAIQSFKDNSYITDFAADEPDFEYAVRVVRGGADLVEKYSDKYYMNVLEYPRVTDDDVFSSMFGVTSYTKSDSRSMEIITYLNTNSDLRNVLQYGVEGVHYKLDNNGVVEMLKDTYQMDLRNTGNAFIAYPDEGMNADVWKWGKLQNADAKSSLILAFRVDKEKLEEFKEPPAEGEEAPSTPVTYLNVAQLKAIEELSDQCAAELAAVKSVAEMQELIDKYTTLGDKGDVKAQVNNSSESAIYNIYYNWMIDKGLYVPED